ncbi:response regulator [Euryhalocaulis caribicus]|uniref:response regulator n=1 Tax=Euryhalocaulis caribicus TaxID=1161401 RepID=UPI00039F10F7|nr:response regulator [Euryhalocaulis caribicus]
MPTRHIHLVETDAAVREAFEAFANAYGFPVRTYADLDLFMGEAAPDAVDLVVIDLPAPGALQRLEPWLAHLPRQPRLMVFSGLGSECFDRALKGHEGAVAFRKPLNPEHLLESIIGSNQAAPPAVG